MKIGPTAKKVPLRFDTGICTYAVNTNLKYTP